MSNALQAMTHELILMRHAHSELAKRGQFDSARPLSQRGYTQASEAARWLATKKLAPNRIVCSPALRARATMAAVLPSLNDTEQLIDPRIFQASMHSLVTVIQTHADVHSVLLVGHNPGLEQLCGWLCHQQQSSPVVWSMPPASIAVFTFSSVADTMFRSARFIAMWKP